MIQIAGWFFPRFNETRHSIWYEEPEGRQERLGSVVDEFHGTHAAVNQSYTPDRWEIKTNEGYETLHVLHPSHSSPLKTESPHSIHTISLRIDLIDLLLCAANQETLLHTSAQSATNDEIHQIDILVPVVGHHEEVRVEAERITRVSHVLTPKAQTGREEVSLGVEVGKERI